MDSTMKQIAAIVALLISLSTLGGIVIGAYKNLVEAEQAHAREAERLQQTLCRLRTHVRALENITTSEHPAYTAVIIWDVDPCDARSK